MPIRQHASTTNRYAISGTLPVCIAAILTLLLVGCDSGESDVSRGSAISVSEDPGRITLAEESSPDTKSAILGIRDESDSFQRVLRLATILIGLGPESVQEVENVVRDPYTWLRPIDVLMLVEFWARHDPEGATRWATGASDAAYRGSAIGIAAEEWARQDPQSVIEAYGTGVNPVLRAVVRGWFDSGKPGLEEFVAGLGASPEGQRALALFIRKTIERYGTATAMDWARDQVDIARAGKLAINRQTASELAMSHPDAAVAWCAEICEGPFGDSVRSVIARRWAAIDPVATFAWIVGTESHSREEVGRAARAAFRVWLQNNKNAAMEWAQSVSETNYDEPWMAPIFSMYVAVVSWKDPHEAIRWAKWIPAETERELAYISIARRWRDIDESAANEWLASSRLSEEAKARASEYPRGYQGKARDESENLVEDSERSAESS